MIKHFYNMYVTSVWNMSDITIEDVLKLSILSVTNGPLKICNTL